jgi:Uma2 family endonuclease
MGYGALREDERFNYGQYLQWDGPERWELIDGVPFSMSPAPTPGHQRLSGRLFHRIYGQLRGKKCQAFYAPVDVRIPYGDEPDDEIMTTVQPDLVVVCDPKKIDQRGIRGAPDFVIEILSPSTSLRDRTDKLALYERSGVREYWIVDPTERDVLVMRLGDAGKWTKPTRHQAPERVPIAALPGVSVDLAEVFEGE